MSFEKWLNELLLLIKQLPASEVSRVEQYYNELYYDKIDNGEKEIYILAEFGSSNDVANNIIAEFERDNGTNANQNQSNDSYNDSDNAPSGDNSSSISPSNTCFGGSCQAAVTSKKVDICHIIVAVLIGIVALPILLSVVVSLWTIPVVFMAVGGGIGIGGIAVVIAAALVIPVGIELVLAYIGGGLVMFGIGMLLLVAGIKLTGVFAMATKKVWQVIVSLFKNMCGGVRNEK